MLVIGGACLVAWAVPATPVIAAPASPAAPATPSASPGCVTPPCGDAAAAHLTLAQAVDRTAATVGKSVTYTITISNSGVLPAAAVTVSDVLGGTAGYLVDDGTAGTANTFVGAPVVTITRVVTGHYDWTYPIVNPGTRDIVRFRVTTLALPGAQATRAHPIVLTSTASAAGVAPAMVSTTVAFPAHSGAASGVPSTGSDLNASAAGFLLLGGLGFILLALYARECDRAAGCAELPPAPSR